MRVGYVRDQAEGPYLRSAAEPVIFHRHYRSPPKLTHIYTRLKAVASRPIPLQQVAKPMRMLTESPTSVVSPGLTPPQLPDRQLVNSLILVIKE
jgi:hypothetical protein